MLEEYKAYPILKRLLSEHIKPYSWSIFFAIIFMIIGASCSYALIKKVKPIIDEIFITRNRTMLVMMPLAILGISTIKGIADYFQAYIMKYTGQRILTDLQIRMYEHLLLADLSFIQSQSAGRLISRFTNDISLMRGAVSHFIIGCAKHFLTVLFLIILMFTLEPLLATAVFVVFPIAIYPVQKLGRKMRKITGDAQEELSNYTAKLDETFYSIKIIKSFSGEKIESFRAKTIVQNILNFYKRAARSDALTSPIMEILSGIVIAGITWYGGYLIIEEKTTPGALFAFITAFVSAYRPFKSLVSLNVNLQEGIAATKRIFHILDIQPKIIDAPGAKNMEFSNHVIALQDVSLKLDNKTAIKSLNLTIPEGCITAIVGRSGSGKTSLANLLVRFYDPSSGVILFDGHNIKEFTVSSLRKQVALVTQDTILFDTTAAANIAYGFDKIDMDTVVKAAKLADAHEFIMHLPDGYDTMIGNQGMKLSGGQRQRISIARAFLKDAPILIFDEATSALDPASEKAIINSLMQIRKGKTILIITHRLSGIIKANNIIVMKAGNIVESGTHAELLAKKSEYYELYDKELKHSPVT